MRFYKHYLVLLNLKIWLFSENLVHCRLFALEWYPRTMCRRPRLVCHVAGQILLTNGAIEPVWFVLSDCKLTKCFEWCVCQIFSRLGQWRRIMNFDANLLAEFDNFYGFYILHLLVYFIYTIPHPIFETGCAAWSCCSCIPYCAGVALYFALLPHPWMRLHSPLYGVA